MASIPSKWTIPEQVVTAGTIGGIAASLNGGNFGVGFVSAGAGAAVGQIFNDSGQVLQRVVGAGLVGGTVSEMTGGKFKNGAATAAFAAAIQEGTKKFSNSSIEDAVIKKNSSREEFAAHLEDARNIGLAAIDELKLVVLEAQNGDASSESYINKYFGKADLNELSANLTAIKTRLAGATLTEADADYIASRQKQGDMVGAYTKAREGDLRNIFYNPAVTQDSNYFAALLVHEAAHLANIGHQRMGGSIVYGSAKVIKFAKTNDWSNTSGNASTYSCAAFSKATDC